MHPQAAWIRLTKTGVSARRLNRLLDHFGGPEALFAASPAAVAAAAQCSASVAAKLLDPVHQPTARELDLLETLEVRLITRDCADYPPALAQIYDPPVAIYVRGTLEERDSRAVALVGSRQASDYGKRVADRLVCGLVEAGYTIVSGLARGLDTAAHQAAVRVGGRTLACLGCGVDVAYPRENRRLAQMIVENGALISEYPMLAAPDAWHFPSRNRIISGLSLGVVVIEAPEKSGSLITAECALEQGREVFAVPGNIDNFRNQGAHALLRDGAKLVQCVEDILEELGNGPAQHSLPLELEPPPRPTLSGDEAKLFALLTSDPQPVDDLILETGMPAGQVSATLLFLEMKGLARRLPGNAYIRTD